MTENLPTPPSASDSGLAHVEQTYLAEPQRERRGLALCLSGGGFRAALFHLGALRRLGELGVLSQVDSLTSVSGGSIMAAHLAASLHPWPDPGAAVPGDVFEREVAVSLRSFTSQDIRTVPLLRWLLLPWNWPRTDLPIEAVAARYQRDLTSLPLADLPDRPRYILCATDIMYGVCWTFTRDGMGDYQAGTFPVPADFPLATAVAASACFPPVFDAMRLRLGGSSGPVLSARSSPSALQQVRLSDGGVYDNLGLEPVWKTARTVLVSDGGAVFHFASSRTLPSRILRYADILSNQVGALRKRWLIASFVAPPGPGQLNGAYWGIGSAARHYRSGAPGYPPALVDGVVSRVRTDLDAFSTAEAFVLENHGYCLADAAVQQHVLQLVSQAALPFQIPHPAYMDEALVRSELRDSNVRHLLGRGWLRSLLP